MVGFQFLHVAWLPVPDQGLRAKQKAVLQRFLIDCNPSIPITGNAVTGVAHVFTEFHFLFLAVSAIDSLHGEL